MRVFILSCLFLLYVAGHCCFANGIECLQQTYKSQLGVRELTGNNDGERVQQYLASTNLKGNYSWCAAFVNWCLQQCGVKTINSAWAPSWFPQSRLVFKQNKIISRQPAAGDVFGIYFPAKQRIAHVGFIDSWKEGSYATCIEGNTNEAGSREGDGVYKKYRLKSQIYAVSSWLE